MKRYAELIGNYKSQKIKSFQDNKLDVAIYETFARMSQPWINNIPEVSWHGNNGSQYTGPECASSRYTEARLSPVVEEGMFAGINKNNVPMIQNFSEDAEWPEVLPAIFPRLLVNGCQGIGSTIANTWLPNDLGEVVEIIKKYISTGEVDTKNIFPSFPTGGIIINKDEVHTIYETGKGKVVLRGRATIEGNKILITELPYQVYVQPYVEELTEMAINDEISGIESVYNKSGKNKLLIEINCYESPRVVLNNLYAKTNLQKSFSANQWALIGKTPKLLTLKDYCEVYLNHNIECLIRELNYDINKAKDRLHIVEGLLIALEDIDNVIKLIKNSENSEKAKIALIEKYNLTEIQAKSILAMRLSSLAHIEKIELENEKKELVAKIADITDILSNSGRQKNIIKERLTSLSSKYGKEGRKTELTQIDEKNKEEKEIAFVEPEKCVVVLTANNTVKRIPQTTFKSQHKNGKGVKTQEDITVGTIRTNTIDNLLIFTDKAKVYKLLVDKIPSGTNSSKGTSVMEFINAEVGETAKVIYSLYRDNAYKYVLFVTKNGMIKKSPIGEYTNIKKSNGVGAITLRENDSIASVSFVTDEPLYVVTKKGYVIKFNSAEVGASGRMTAGVKAINLTDGDEVISTLPIRNATDKLALFTSTGVGKKINQKEVILQKRGGRGLICYKSDENNYITSASMIEDADTLLVCGKKSNICIKAEEIPELGRTAAGSSIIKNDTIVSVTKI